VLTVGALHQADSAALRLAAIAWHDELAPLPKPLLIVNIGGPTSNSLSFSLLLSFMLHVPLYVCLHMLACLSQRPSKSRQASKAAL
jgi:hypothetical protein